MKTWQVCIALTFLILGAVLVYPPYEEYRHQKWLDSLPEYDPEWSQTIASFTWVISNETYTETITSNMTIWTGPNVYRITFIYNETSGEWIIP